MEKNRLEAFSDGVLAIIITIMVLELKVPQGSGLAALRPLLPDFFAYALSFVYVGIYWNNHHHLIKACHSITGGIMWANLHLLFWLSLFPFMTGWMGQNDFSAVPSAVYGAVLLCAAVAYYLLQNMIVAHEGGPESQLGRALGDDWKGKLSMLLYALGIASALLHADAAIVFYSLVAVMWLIPDRRLERILSETGD